MPNHDYPSETCFMRGFEVPSWDEIVRIHGPPTYRTAWRILGHAEDCEDVVQEVFIEAHKLFLASKVTHWRTFLNRLVTFRALDSLRRRTVVGSLDEALVCDTSPAPEAATINREEERRFRSIVASLAPRQAEVFCLAHFEELSHEEIASTLEISTNAVAIALHKARSTLRATVLDLLKEHNP